MAAYFSVQESESTVRANKYCDSLVEFSRKYGVTNQCSGVQRSQRLAAIDSSRCRTRGTAGASCAQGRTQYRWGGTVVIVIIIYHIIRSIVCRRRISKYQIMTRKNKFRLRGVSVAQVMAKFLPKRCRCSCHGPGIFIHKHVENAGHPLATIPGDEKILCAPGKKSPDRIPSRRRRLRKLTPVRMSTPRIGCPGRLSTLGCGY